jgi:hypothetical protein
MRKLSELAWRVAIGVLALCSLSIAAGAVEDGAEGSSCPLDAIPIAPGASIQAAIDRAGDGAAFCLKNGVHRAQAVRPRSRQKFYGEGRTILNGSRLLTGFRRDGDGWVADSRLPPGRRHGECLPGSPMCDRPEALFIDDRPLTRVASRDALASGKFFVDDMLGTIHLADDPTARKVEFASAAFAFESRAADVLIRNVTVEKFASAAQKGAIHAREGARWTIEDCEVRLNSGAGLSVGSGSRVRNSDVHHNGQIGIEGNGTDIVIEHNRIWSNNSHGFDPTWEAGGVKIAQSDGVTFRANYVHDNDGPGLWCDIDCRNVAYEGNLVEGNRDVGIFHEISFNAVIRNNVVRHNGLGDRGWFWAADILLAASQDVEVSGNTLMVAPGRCGVILIDQGRRSVEGTRYKTRNNTIRANDMTFESAACAGGASDTKPGDENFAIIAEGNNRFDGNTYRVPRHGGPARFVWGREVTDWGGFRRKGLEQNGHLVPF